MDGVDLTEGREGGGNGVVGEADGGPTVGDEQVGAAFWVAPPSFCFLLFFFTLSSVTVVGNLFLFFFTHPNKWSKCES